MATSARVSSTVWAETAVKSSWARAWRRLAWAAVRFSLRRIHRGFVGGQRRDLLVARLLAHNSLRGQGHGAAGVGLLVIVLRLSLGERCLRHLYLRLGAGDGAAGLAAVLLLGLHRPAQLGLVAGRVSLGGLQRGLQIIALDDRDQLPGLHVVAFLNGERLDAARNLGAHNHFVGVDRADQLQIARARHGDQVPDQRPHRKQAQNQKTRLRAFTCCVPQILEICRLRFFVAGIGVSASTLAASFAPRRRS